MEVKWQKPYKKGEQFHAFRLLRDFEYVIEIFDFVITSKGQTRGCIKRVNNFTLLGFCEILNM
jgi:hypothetical protein